MYGCIGEHNIIINNVCRYENRKMMQVTINDATEADQQFEILMGDQVEPRREFIDNNALSVSNLDI